MFRILRGIPYSELDPVVDLTEKLGERAALMT